MSKQYDREFKENAVRYYKEHKDLNMKRCATDLGIAASWTYDGFVYLTSVMDLYSRKIISWVLSPTLESKWIVQAINKAKAIRNVKEALIIHSDRGIQYTCEAYRNAELKI